MAKSQISLKLHLSLLIIKNIPIKFESYISRLYIEIEEYTNTHIIENQPKPTVGSLSSLEADLCTARATPGASQTLDWLPYLPAPPLHGEKRRSVIVMRSSRIKFPWRVTATRWSPVTHTTAAIDSKTKKPRCTHLSGACLSEADGKEKIWHQKIKENEDQPNAPPATRTITSSPPDVSR